MMITFLCAHTPTQQGRWGCRGGGGGHLLDFCYRCVMPKIINFWGVVSTLQVLSLAYQGTHGVARTEKLISRWYLSWWSLGVAPPTRLSGWAN